jgi:hypothetical protein
MALIIVYAAPDMVAYGGGSERRVTIACGKIPVCAVTDRKDEVALL